MGLLISRFRKKKNAEELLGDLTQKIEKIEEFQECEEDKLRTHVKHLVIYSAVIYVFILVIFFILNPESGKKYYVLTFILFPIVTFLVRRLIIFYYKRKITRNKLKIEVYKKEKQKIIDDVKETETYKVAKRILEKYDVPQAPKKFTPPRVSTPIPIPKPTPGTVTPYQSLVNTDLRRRVTSRDSFFNQSNQLMSAQKAPPTLVRPIVTENKGVFDRIIQKVVGDGPNERYALICKACGSHNGMALEEEFEFLSYRCAFCSFFNPARKQRVAMQKVLMQNLNLMALKNTSDSDSSDDKRPLEITELEDSESESKDDKPSPESKKDGEKIVIAEEPTSSDVVHNLEKACDAVATVDKEVESASNAKQEETVEETSCNENKENECINVDVVDIKEDVENSGESDIQSGIKLNVEESSPMEVDEDESPAIDLSTSVKDITLKS